MKIPGNATIAKHSPTLVTKRKKYEEQTKTKQNTKSKATDAQTRKNCNRKTAFEWLVGTLFGVGSLTLVMLNKLWCHAHFWFPANQISWSRFLIYIRILDGKQCRSDWSGYPLFAKTGHVVFGRRMIKLILLAQNSTEPRNSDASPITCIFSPLIGVLYLIWAQLFKTNDVVSLRIVKSLII